MTDIFYNDEDQTIIVDDEDEDVPLWLKLLIAGGSAAAIYIAWREYAASKQPPPDIGPGPVSGGAW